MDEITTARRSKTLLVLSYLMYLLVAPAMVTPLIGIVIAYSQRDRSFDWQRGHYEYLIRTFWIALPIFVVALVTQPLGIGHVVMLALGVWYYLRLIVGGLRAINGTPLPNPRSGWL